MSEEIKTTDNGAHHPQNEKITSAVKTKDPRRVEAGKRLGMISKQAKEKKLAQMREASAKQSKADVGETSNWFSNTLVSSPVVSIGFVGLVGLVLYYGYDKVAGYNKKYKSLTSSSDVKDGSSLNGIVVNGSKNEANPKPKRVYKELDTLD